MNQKKAGVILSYISEAIKILTSLLYTPIMLRLLGQSEYGLYQLVHSVVSYLGLFSLGFTSAYVRYFSLAKAKGSEEDVAKLNGMFMTIFLIIAGIAASCGGVMVHNIRAVFGTGLTDQEYVKARSLMILMVFNLSVSFPNSVFNCIISAHERFFFQRMLTILQNLLNPFLTLPLLLMGYGSVGIVLVTTAITLAKLAVDMWFVFRRLHARFVFHGFNFYLVKDIWSFTFFIFLNQIINQINWNVDRFLLGRMIGTAAVAVYGLGAQINTMYLQFSTAISSVFVPQINRMVAGHNDNHELSKLFSKVGRIQFMLLGLIMSGFIFTGRTFMRLWGGSAAYEESYYVALLLIVPVTVPLIQNLGIEIQRAKNMHQTRSIVYACIAILNIFVSIPLVHAYGPCGAAIGTAFSLIIGNVVFMNWYYATQIGLEIMEFWKNILSITPALILPIILGLIMISSFHVRSFGSITLFAIFYTVTYCISLWIWGLNTEEKKIIGKLTQNIMRRFHDHNQKQK